MLVVHPSMLTKAPSMPDMEGANLNMTEYYLAWALKYQHGGILFGMSRLISGMGVFIWEGRILMLLQLW